MTVYEQAIKTYGADNQKLKCIEELSELSRAIARVQIEENLAGEHNLANLIEEIADVEIMIEQVKMIYGVAEKVIHTKLSKLERLKRKIEEFRRVG